MISLYGVMRRGKMRSGDIRRKLQLVNIVEEIEENKTKSGRNM
jgi:hypothetical protein